MTTQLSLLDRDWVSTQSDRVITWFRNCDDGFTSDDLHGFVPEPEQMNWYGILIASLASRGLIERIGSIKSSRPEANGRWIGVYKVKP